MQLFIKFTSVDDDDLNARKGEQAMEVVGTFYIAKCFLVIVSNITFKLL